LRKVIQEIFFAGWKKGRKGSGVNMRTPASPAGAAAGTRQRRDVVKRKRLIEEEDFAEPHVKRDLLSQEMSRLKAAANAMALSCVGHWFERERTDSATAAGPTRAFVVGDNVMARYSDGKFYSAVVAEHWQESGAVKYRLAWDDGDTRARVKTAGDMLLLEDFTKCAERLLKRQKCSPAKGGGAEKAVAPDNERVKKRALTSRRSAAVYSFNAAGGGAEQAFLRRDWGLRMVRAVGRNRPPFARTMLYNGTLPSVLESLSQTRHFNQVGLGGLWVVKRWPGSNARKLIDTQVHECIRSNPHPHLVRILDVSSTEGVLMDYFEDGDLHTGMLTARRTFVPVAQVVRYLLQLMQGLAHLHALDVVHCDVTPANIFLRGERESLALGDFGHSYILNKHQESRSSVARQGLGAEFVAPEVKDGGPSTKESDIFSAGKILEGLLNLSAASRHHHFKAEMEVQPKSVVRKLRGLSADMCGVSTRRPTSREVCARLQSLAS
jgi:serine/threonine protein kinase